MFNYPLSASSTPTVDQLPARKRSWHASLFDHFNPNSDLSDDQREKLGRQGLLHLGVGLLTNRGGFGNALGQSINSGLLAMNQGADNIEDRKLKQQLYAQRGSDPSGVLHSQRVGADGFIYNTYRDGRTVNTGVKADRQMWFRDHPGMPPELVGKDGVVLPVGGVQFDSMPYVFDDPQNMPTAVVDELTQREAAVGSRRIPSQAPRAATPRPSEAQTAAEIEAAKQQVQIGALPMRGQIEAQNAGMKTAAEESAKLKADREAGKGKAALATGMAADRAKRVDEGVNSILPRIGYTTTGWLGDKLAGVSGTDAFDLRADVGSLQAIAGFDELNAMRASSPTGGALGNVTERELKFLQSVVANIETSQSPEQLKRNLEKFRTAVKASWQRVEQAYNEQYGGAQPSDSGSVDDILSKYGIR